MPLGAGTEYARKYVKATQDQMRHTVIPECADECARKRVQYVYTPQQYRECLKNCIRDKIRALVGAT